MSAGANRHRNNIAGVGCGTAAIKQRQQPLVQFFRLFPIALAQFILPNPGRQNPDHLHFYTLFIDDFNLRNLLKAALNEKSETFIWQRRRTVSVEEQMMKPSLKKEQLALLKFEKQLIGLGASLGALHATTSAGTREIVGDLADAENIKLQEAYLNLVEAVQTAHNAIEESAVRAGAELLNANGSPKTDPLVEIAKSVLGIG